MGKAVSGSALGLEPSYLVGSNPTTRTMITNTCNDWIYPINAMRGWYVRNGKFAWIDVGWGYSNVECPECRGHMYLETCKAKSLAHRG